MEASSAENMNCNWAVNRGFVDFTIIWKLRGCTVEAVTGSGVPHDLKVTSPEPGSPDDSQYDAGASADYVQVNEVGASTCSNANARSAFAHRHAERLAIILRHIDDAGPSG